MICEIRDLENAILFGKCDLCFANPDARNSLFPIRSRYFLGCHTGQYSRVY